MPNYGTIAICPYFTTEDPITIKCDGIVELTGAEVSYHAKFPNKEVKKNFMRKYCESHNWKVCPYAKMMEQQWDDIGKPVRMIVRSADIRAPAKKKKKNNGIKGQLTFKF